MRSRETRFIQPGHTGKRNNEEIQCLPSSFGGFKKRTRVIYAYVNSPAQGVRSPITEPPLSRFLVCPAMSELCEISSWETSSYTVWNKGFNPFLVPA